MKAIKKLFLSCGFVLVVFPAIAAEPGAILVQTVAEREEPYTNEAGEEATRLVPVSTVVPGDVVIYTVTFANTGSVPVENVTVTDPIPEHMNYVEGSAFGPGTDIRFSVDGGRTYATTDALTIIDENGNQQPATAADYTNIQWVLRNPLPPGERGYARFRAVLR